MRLAVALACVWFATAPIDASSQKEILVAPGVFAVAQSPRGIQVFATALGSESDAVLAERLCRRRADCLIGVGPGARREVAFGSLTSELQSEVVAALMPLDRCEGGHWRHFPSPRFAPDGSYEQLATWFATDATAANRLVSAVKHSEASGGIRLPLTDVVAWLRAARAGCDETAARASGGADLLLAEPTPATVAVPEVVAAKPVTASPSPRDLFLTSRAVVEASPAAAPAAGTGDLTYGRDRKGAYASYHLKAGEAVYSSVILRFSGRVHAADVNELVPVIAERSGVRSFRDLPIGFEIKVPLEYLSAEFLPESDQRRRDYEQRQREVARYKNSERAALLDGVVVMLDAGHGGNDRGASSNGVWESDYVYDILCRIKRRLERDTRARVVPLVKNASLDYSTRDEKHLRPLVETSVLTSPPYLLEDPSLGVNLRWYLANSHYRRAIAGGTDPGRVVFTSIHADSLHSSVRGAMVYVPAEEYTTGRHGRRDGAYSRFREVREAPVIQQNAIDRRRAEGLSRDFARHLLDSFAIRTLPVHEQKPIRGSVLRNRREWLPAVLRANQVPVRVLLEVCNLNNPEDSKLLETPRFREAVAESYVDALLSYYGNESRTLVARDGR